MEIAGRFPHSHRLDHYDEDEYPQKPGRLRDTHSEGKVKRLYELTGIGLQICALLENKTTADEALAILECVRRTVLNVSAPNTNVAVMLEN